MGNWWVILVSSAENEGTGRKAIKQPRRRLQLGNCGVKVHVVEVDGLALVAGGSEEEPSS